jgi:CSLREA domain-containing protein
MYTRSFLRDLALGLLAASWASAATVVVDTTADAVDASVGDGLCLTATGACSLRAAVQQANFLAGSDAITLPAGTYALTLSGGSSEDGAAAGDLDVQGDLTITGAGAATTTISGQNTTRVFEATNSNPSTIPIPTLALIGLTVRDGVAGPDGCEGVVPFTYARGDGICSNGMRIALTDVVVTQNAGQGIGVVGPLTMLRSVVSGNGDGAIGSHAGIATLASTVAITDSTIAGNDGIGIALGVLGGSAVFRNSTVADNGETGISSGGGCDGTFCYAATPVTLQNVTISGHTGFALANVVQFLPGNNFGPAPATISNSVLAGPGAACPYGATSAGHNLLEVAGGCVLSGNLTGNVVGAPALLGPLAANGGPTPTQIPQGGSLALNGGSPAAPGSGAGACEATDQRGAARPVGSRCDLGAVESACGDGLPNPGELCDDGNAIDGDGCDRHCAPSACGNRILAGSETCDDGNTATGDCCSPTCQTETGTSCDDGDPCTSGDVCGGGGVCQAGPGCPSCLTCSPGVGCVAPTDTCAGPVARGARLLIKDGPGTARDALSFKWKSQAALSKADFGFPATTDLGYSLCLYDDAGGATELPIPANHCDAAGCWTENNSGFRYRSGPGLPGKLRATFKAKTPGQISFDRRRAPGIVPVLPLTTPVRARFRRLDLDPALCAEATFQANVKRNTIDTFKAVSD